MKIQEFMSKNVELLPPTATLRQAAEKMSSDIGFIPVGENDRIIGAITDRDIVIRAVAKGKNPDCEIKEFISEHIQWCYENDTLETAAKKMQSLQIRRLIVLNEQKRLVGIVSLGDIATHCTDDALVGVTTEKVSASYT